MSVGKILCTILIFHILVIRECWFNMWIKSSRSSDRWDPHYNSFTCDCSGLLKNKNKLPQRISRSINLSIARTIASYGFNRWSLELGETTFGERIATQLQNYNRGRNDSLVYFLRELLPTSYKIYRRWIIPKFKGPSMNPSSLIIANTVPPTWYFIFHINILTNNYNQACTCEILLHTYTRGYCIIFHLGYNVLTGTCG